MSTDAKKPTSRDNVIPMPDIYAEEFAVDESFLEDIEIESKASDKESGFNPYDTAVLYRK
jgi:hypothetical protein